MLIPFVVQLVTVGGSIPGTQTPSEWRAGSRVNAPAHGKPTEENLKAYVARFEASTQEGGVNAHIGPVTVMSAFIKDQRSGEVKATYRGPSFVLVP